ncbi:hypothetical protein BDY21DRAFT_38399 [Lineolata rhizophorae]|uniref:Azaphilone pigments biosynthesis cluster protein L N-terminal domain-containing protein n=1 Tax=Lineolata rhizophorae TaxID=578093 RepID=A0A6A6P074_9PEZI|nr:hypothetical protein BDY21DRAFT_38399 [Lineolata rhizophorae]
MPVDPLSISALCVTLIGATGRVSVLLDGFVRDVRDARTELDAVARELLSLRTVLSLVSDDCSVETTSMFPETLCQQIEGIVRNCGDVMDQMEKALKKHDGGRVQRAMWWGVTGKEDMRKLRGSLIAHNSALGIALDLMALTLSTAIKADTTEIRNDAAQIKNDTTDIKHDTAQILAEIARLQAQLPREKANALNQGSGDYSGSDTMLERYLNDMTSYAETVGVGTAEEDSVAAEGPSVAAEGPSVGAGSASIEVEADYTMAETLEGLEFCGIPHGSLWHQRSKEGLNNTLF